MASHDPSEFGSEASTRMASGPPRSPERSGPRHGRYGMRARSWRSTPSRSSSCGPRTRQCSALCRWASSPTPGSLSRRSPIHATGLPRTCFPRAVLVDAGAPCGVRTTARRRVAVVVPCPRYGESSTSPARVDAARAQAALRKPRADRKDAGPARVSARGSPSVRAVRTERECGSSPERSYRLMGERADRPHL